MEAACLKRHEHQKKAYEESRRACADRDDEKASAPVREDNRSQRARRSGDPVEYSIAGNVIADSTVYGM